MAADVFAQTAPEAPQQIWQARLPEPVESIAVPSNAACISAKTKTWIHVIDRNGRRMWEARLRNLPQNPIRNYTVSPTCDWIAVETTADVHASFSMEIIRKDGTRKSVSLSAAEGANGPLVQSLDISPDGKLLAIGFESNFLWIVSREGNVRARLGPLQASGVTARFTADSRRVLVTGWFSTGMLNIEGKWIWKSDSRNLIASRSTDLFAGLSAPMHGPQGGDIVILDAAGKVLWKDFGWDAMMAIAPNGRFVVFTSRTKSPNQPTQPPFPISPVLTDTPEIWVRDRTGKVLAHGPFEGQLAGVSIDSSCVLVQSTPTQNWLAGLNRSLKEVWRWNIEGLVPFSEVRHDLLFGLNGDLIRAYRLPTCNP